MAKLYVFGIGGTGARVLRSFTMMMAAGVTIDADEVVPVIIDPDAANADLTRTVALMNIYRSIRSSLSFSPQNEVGKDNVTEDIIKRIKSVLQKERKENILADEALMPAWIRNITRKAYE